MFGASAAAATAVKGAADATLRTTSAWDGEAFRAAADEALEAVREGDASVVGGNLTLARSAAVTYHQRHRLVEQVLMEATAAEEVRNCAGVRRWRVWVA